MRKILLACCALVCSLAASAATFNQLEINLADGEKMTAVINSDLQLSFSDTDFIAQGGDVDITVPKAEIVSFTHGYANSVSEIADAADYEILRGEIRFSNLPADTRVAVVSAAGQTISSQILSGDARLSLDGLSSGVYVIAFGDRSFKVTVK